MTNGNRRLLALALLAVGATASAGPGDAWHGDLHVDAPATFSQNTGVLQLTERVAGSWYFKPLLDDGQQPLGLLGFLQHPGTATLTLSGLSFANLSGTVYPWQDTGLTASVGASVGLASEAVSSSYSAGLLHYFSPSFRMEVLYLGSRGHAGISDSTVELETSRSRSERGQLDLSLLLEGRALLSLTFQMGPTWSYSRTVPAPLGDLTTSSVQGLNSSVTASIAGYFGRHFSAALSGGARDLGTTIHNSAQQATHQLNGLTLFGGVDVQHFVTDTLYLRANFEDDWTLETIGSLARPNTLSLQLTVTLGGRL